MSNIVKCKTIGCYADAFHNGYCVDCGERSLSTAKRDYSYAPPLPKGLLLSVEIEANAPNEKALKTGSNLATCCSDASLSGGSLSGEFKLCATSAKQLIRESGRLVRKLTALGWGVDRSCGLHIGVDLRPLTNPEYHDEKIGRWCLPIPQEDYHNGFAGMWSSCRLAYVGVWLYRLQDVFFGLIPESRRNNSYCAKFPSYPNPWSGIMDRMRSHHSLWANTVKSGRLEIRLHPGTLNPQKLAGWIDLWSQLQAYFLSDAPLFRHHVPDCGELPGYTPPSQPKEKTFQNSWQWWNDADGAYLSSVPGGSAQWVPIRVEDILRQGSKGAIYFRDRQRAGGTLRSERQLAGTTGEAW